MVALEINLLIEIHLDICKKISIKSLCLIQIQKTEYLLRKPNLQKLISQNYFILIN